MNDRHLRTALLIDADNVSLDVVGQVITRLQDAGRRLQHRRAYGSVQKASEFAALCRDHAIRFLPSTFAGPNATDIALAIDAVELVLRQPMDEIVILSSDMDFSPLIVRLRELGCRVSGFGQRGKSGNDVRRDYERVYDSFEIIGPTSGRPRPSTPPAAAAATTPAAAEGKSGPAKKTRTKANASPRARGKVAAASAAPAAKAAATDETRAAASPPPPLPAQVQALLDACPELAAGTPVRLNGVAKALRDRGMLKKNGKTTTLFKKLGGHFELQPADTPESVRYIGG